MDTAQAMSQENVEIVRRSFDVWNAGDVDAIRRLYTEDVRSCSSNNTRLDL